jgi:hypothetical protein
MAFWIGVPISAGFGAVGHLLEECEMPSLFSLAVSSCLGWAGVAVALLIARLVVFPVAYGTVVSLSRRRRLTHILGNHSQ